MRVNETGYQGRRGGVDLMVAMNPQTWAQDLKEIETGGYLFYDNSKPLPKSKFRDDINVIGMPLTEICNATYSDPRQRQLFKNIIYVGALSALMEIDPDEIEKLFSEQYKGKEALLQSNVKALRLGRDYAQQHLSCPIGLRVKRANNVGNKIFVDGNTAAALGAVYGGATVCAWYPITPSSSLAEAFIKHCQKYRVDPATGKSRYAIIQGEDELASVGIAIGAGWNGARAFTCTSGPGISLMQEFIGLAYFAEIPVVLIDVQRGGPSTGMPTRTQQSDLLSCAYASHGDTKHVLLFPEDPTECFEFSAQAFDLAERLQTPVFVMTDLDIGMNTRLCDPFQWDDSRAYDRGKVMALRGPRGRQGIRPLPRRGRRRHPLPHLSGHAPDARRLLHARHHQGPLRALQRGRPGLRRQHAAAAAQVRDREAAGAQAPAASRPRNRRASARSIYGSTSPAMHGGAGRARPQRGIHVNALRVRGFPFQDEIADFVASHPWVFVIEQNRDAQLKTLLVNEAKVNPSRLLSVLHYDGTPITARFIVEQISQHAAARTVVPLKKVV